MLTEKAFSKRLEEKDEAIEMLDTLGVNELKYIYFLFRFYLF